MGRIKRLKSIVGKNVKFYNSLNHDELSKLLKSMDLNFLPSISEGFPKVILETAHQHLFLRLFITITEL